MLCLHGSAVSEIAPADYVVGLQKGKIMRHGIDWRSYPFYRKYRPLINTNAMPFVWAALLWGAIYLVVKALT